MSESPLLNGGRNHQRDCFVCAILILLRQVDKLQFGIDFGLRRDSGVRRGDPVALSTAIEL
jgi:hypothetical protein